MTDPTDEETTTDGDDEVPGDPAPPGADAAGTDEPATASGDEAGPEDTPPGREAEAGGRSGETKGDPSPPQQLLDALGDEIDDVRRRAADADPSQAEEKPSVEEGEADRDQPVDDAIVPPA